MEKKKVMFTTKAHTADVDAVYSRKSYHDDTILGITWDLVSWSVGRDLAILNVGFIYIDCSSIVTTGAARKRSRVDPWEFRSAAGVCFGWFGWRIVG